MTLERITRCLLIAPLLVAATVSCDHTTGPGAKQYDTAREALERAVTQEQLAQAQRLLLIAAKAGNLDAQHQLANRMWEGEGCEVDRVEAAKWYETSFAAGHFASVTGVALTYEQGWLGTVDLHTALDLHKAAHDAGLTRGTIGLAAHYRRGRVVDRNFTEALRLLDQAIAEGDTRDSARAKAEKSRYYFNGWGVPKDLELSLSLAREASEEGSPLGTGLLGHHYLIGGAVERDATRGLNLLERASQSGSASAAYIMYAINHDGAFGAPKDPARALSFLKQASTRGYSDAQLAVAKETIKRGIPSETPGAWETIRILDARNSPPAKLFLATASLEGLYDTPQDPDTAMQKFKEVAADPNALDSEKRFAFKKIAIMFSGHNWKRDSRAREDALLSALALPEPEEWIYLELADLYTNDWKLGDKNKALSHLETAAKAGYVDCMLILAERVVARMDNEEAWILGLAWTRAAMDNPDATEDQRHRARQQWSSLMTRGANWMFLNGQPEPDDNVIAAKAISLASQLAGH